MTTYVLLDLSTCTAIDVFCRMASTNPQPLYFLGFFFLIDTLRPCQLGPPYVAKRQVLFYKYICFASVQCGHFLEYCFYEDPYKKRSSSNA